MTSKEAFAEAARQTIASLGLRSNITFKTWLFLLVKTRRVPACEECHSKVRLELQHKMTCYEDETEIHIYCRRCASEYREYWDDMWSSYYGSVM